MPRYQPDGFTPSGFFTADEKKTLQPVVAAAGLGHRKNVP